LSPSRTLIAYRAASAAAAVLPAPVTRGVAEAAAVLSARVPFGTGPLAAAARRRQLVARHLRRVYGSELADSELNRLVDEAFASYGRYWSESFRLPRLPPARIKAGIVYDGYEHIAAGEAAGRGTILALPHIGGWEWAGTQLALTGHPISVVVEALEPPDVFEWFVSFRKRLGMQVIAAGPGAAALCVRALADNHLLCLLCDRLVAGAAGVEVEFFGERTLLPAGPVTLALRTGAALLPCAVYFGRDPDQHFGKIRPPLPLRRQGRLRDEVQTWTQVLAGELEALIRDAPTQWHLMQPNWPSDRDQPFGRSAGQGSSGGVPTGQASVPRAAVGQAPVGDGPAGQQSAAGASPRWAPSGDVVPGHAPGAPVPAQHSPTEQEPAEQGSPTTPGPPN
jgi:KDO2-lipid IV(A) lauroyltransferase